MNIQHTLQKIISKHNLAAEEMTAVMHAILQGELTPVQLTAFLIAMRMKGETVIEITAAAKVMQQFATPVKIKNHLHLVDIVGTGGDQAHTFNVSTAAAFVIAGAGGVVAKHGNRSASSKSGSADVLEKAGVNLNLTATQIAACVEKIGIGFLFGPAYHTAMQYVTPVRKELGIRTFFNLLGPLTNPAGVKHQVVGVFAKEWVVPVAEVLKQLGSEHALVVHSEDGLDEISIAAPTFVAELKSGVITTYTITPEQFGLSRSALDTMKINNANESLELLNQVFANQNSAARDIVLLNAGAGIYVAGLANDINEGINLAKAAIANGKAAEKLQELIQYSPT